MDFYVVMGRPGARIARRKRAKARIGAPHRVRKDDALQWFKQRFDGFVHDVLPFMYMQLIDNLGHSLISNK